MFALLLLPPLSRKSAWKFGRGGVLSCVESSAVVSGTRYQVPGTSCTVIVSFLLPIDAARRYVEKRGSVSYAPGCVTRLTCNLRRPPQSA